MLLNFSKFSKRENQRNEKTRIHTRIKEKQYPKSVIKKKQFKQLKKLWAKVKYLVVRELKLLLKNF